MRPSSFAGLLATFTLATLASGSACGSSGRSDNLGPADAAMPDGRRPGGGGGGGTDAAIDGAPASMDGIAAALAAADGTGLSLPIRGVTVTYVKPLVGSPSNDPAGFTIQAQKPGPALFVAVDPATLSPPAAVGDVVDFTITAKATVARQPRAQAIAGYARSQTGADVGALVQDITAASDVVTAIDRYDGELVTATGTLVEGFLAAGTGFQRAVIATTGLAGNASYQLRVPATLVDAIDMVRTCQFTVTRVPMGRFNTLAQIGAWTPTDVTLRGCPPPVVVGITPTSETTLVLTFSRHILPGSVLPDGSQFTFDHGLTASAAAVAGRTITLTTTAQDSLTTYTTTIAPGVTDLQGSAITGTPAFPGFGGSSGGGAQLSVHTTLGIPSPSSSTNPDSFLSVKSQYVVSYNSSRKVPNWVSWELNTSYLGSTARQDDYRIDDTLPASLPQAQLGDYSNSGFERGHMCPSGDRTLTPASNSETFFLTNMVPQAANNNEGPWAALETECRNLARTGKELFIVSGGTFSATSRVVGQGLVVPDATWKVIVVLDAVGQGPAQVTTSTRVIGVIMPNDDARISKAADWHTFRVSVDTIEAQTGYDFLSDVAPAVQAVIEARVDNQ
ncbi:MAG TPA: DNA/RNA non-specific endonuclease [Kofleriaceae bacterium]|nr:DNA/RNA non-specific endonuclease [Kofleriaceae bacterium]